MELKVKKQTKRPKNLIQNLIQSTPNLIPIFIIIIIIRIIQDTIDDIVIIIMADTNHTRFTLLSSFFLVKTQLEMDKTSSQKISYKYVTFKIKTIHSSVI